MLQMNAISSKDQSELDKFRLFIKACNRWDDAYDTLPEFAPISNDQSLEWEWRKFRAHAAIYKQIFGENP